MARLTEDDLRLAWRTLSESRGNKREAARRLGIDRSTLTHRLERAVLLLGEEVTLSHVNGSPEGLETFSRPLPKRGEVATYILTSAQNNTFVHPQLWKNLEALAKDRSGEILISRFNYNLSAYGRRAVKPGRAKTVGSIWFAPEVEAHASDDRIQLAPGLVWCGELQIEPTANRPLSGFETYAGRASCIIPHTTVAMESVASGKHEAAKFLYSTGACTELNYIQKRAGLKAENRHVFGALVVEVDSDGCWFVRQIEQGTDGRLWDLTDFYEDGVRNSGQRVEDVTWGDAHADMVDETASDLAWGEGGMLDTLQPRSQHVHDLLNFSRRGHHDRKDPFKMLRYHVRGRDSVVDEFQATGDLVQRMLRPWVETNIVNSNHNRHLKKWLAEADWRDDLVNAEILLALQLATVQAIKEGEDNFDPTQEAVEYFGGKGATWLGMDEPHIICHKFDGGIECGMHGDVGPNGARGSAAALAKMGRRCNIGHAHSARIIDGVYQAGTSSKFDLEYNDGPSSWSHSHIVTYPNGTRAIVTMWKGKWRTQSF
jgi:hypothetical protein